MSLKEYGHSFTAVRDGLITLENAFYELITGIENQDNLDSLLKEGSTLLNDGNARYSIELELYGNVTGLWNSKETRYVFLAMMHGKSLLTCFNPLNLDFCLICFFLTF